MNESGLTLKKRMPIYRERVQMDEQYYNNMSEKEIEFSVYNLHPLGFKEGLDNKIKARIKPQGV